MRAVGLLIVAGVAGCTNDLMKVEFASASASGVGGHWFIGAERGETIDLDFKLDGDDISSASGWSVDVEGPVGVRSTVKLTGPITRGSFTLPASTAGSYSKLGDKAFTFHLRDSDGTVQESRRWAATIVDPGPAPRAWLWGAFWTTDGERLIENNTQCSSEMTVVAYVGGDLSRASRVDIQILDVDTIASDDVVQEQTFMIATGVRMYELAVDDPCQGEFGSDSSNKIDPKFKVTLSDSSGSEIDSIEGPELD